MILPQGGLAISISSTVWVGVIVTCFFNLRLGWPLSGLVIPGFLTPLFIIKPLIGIIDILEGILAYLLVKTIAHIGIKTRKLDNFFGRDLFFAVITSSVLIRLIFEGWILIWLANYLQIKFNYQIDYRANFNGYGLIIVALIAYQFSKKGFVKNIISFLITIIITYILVRYGLMELTNFRISQVNSLYSNIEEIFPSSAKTYIILLITTLFAERMSRKYGWDYGGILISGLLALQWYSPLRIGMTILEALIIYIVASFLMNTRFFEQKNIVLARKILLFFNIGFIYKIFLGDFVMRIFPEERVLEFYGFGYLLSTLIALKMHDKNNLKVMFMALHTSFSGFVFGSIIAFILAIFTNILNPINILVGAPLEKINEKEIEYKEDYLINIMATYKANVSKISRLKFLSPSLEEIYNLDKYLLNPLIKIIFQSNQEEDEIKISLNKLNGYANYYGYKIILLKDLLSKHKLVLLSPDEKDERTKNWGIYIFRINGKNDQIIEVPRPFDEASTLDFSTYLFAKTEARFLLIGGTSSDANRDRSADLTRPQAKRSFYNLVSQVILRDHIYNRPIIQIRGFSTSIGSTAKTAKDILIAFSDGAIRETQLRPAQLDIVNLIRGENLSFSLVSSDQETAGHEIGELFLSRYLLQTPNKDLAIIWLNPVLRSAFRNPEGNVLSLSHFETLEIPLIKDSLKNFLIKSSPLSGWNVDAELKELIELYLDSNDILALKNIISKTNYRFKHILFNDDGRDYLAILNLKDQLLGLASLSLNADIQNNYEISIREESRLDLSLRRWIIFKDL